MPVTAQSACRMKAYSLYSEQEHWISPKIDLKKKKKSKKVEIWSDSRAAGASVAGTTRSPWAHGPAVQDRIEYPDFVTGLHQNSRPLFPSRVNFRLVSSFLVAVIELGVFYHLAHF